MILRVHVSAVETSTGAKIVHIWIPSVASANAPDISSANVITFAIVAPISHTVRLASNRLGTVRQSPKSNDLLKMEVDVNGVQVQFYLDTGAEVNIISKETFDYIGAPSL